MRIAASLFIFGLMVGAPAAQAFDCSKAETRIEKAICADPSLVARDDAMATLYGEVKSLSTPEEQKMLARAQGAWIAEREKQCAATSDAELGLCIRAQIGNRMAELAVKPQSGPGAPSRLIPIYVQQRGGKGVYDIDFRLLRFAKPASAGEKAFNAAVARIIKAAPLGPQADRKDEEHLAQGSTLTLSYASPKLISAKDQFYADEGGAHPNGGSSNINIDMTNGKPLAFAKLFPATTLKTLATQCRDQIVAQKKDKMQGDSYDPATDDFLKDEAIADHVGDLGRWTLKASGASVTFDAYDIGSYAEGEYACDFPIKDLKALALPGASLPE